MVQKNKILILLSFFFVSDLFAKELPSLFEVKISSDQYTNTNEGLNKAFNQLIQRLSGSRNKKFLWKINDAKLKKIDFVSSYSMEVIDDIEFISVKFNSDTLLPELRKIGTPLIGFNRPVILILFKIDDGESAPIYLDGNLSNDLFAFEIKKIFTNIAEERGVYIELPEFDLSDKNLLNQTNILFSPSNYINDKFYNDSFLSFELVRVGINQWIVNGDLNTSSSLQQKQVFQFFQEKIHTFLDDFLEVKPLDPGSEGEKVLISVNGLDNFQDFEAVQAELDKIFAIRSKSFHAFERTKVDYIAELFQSRDSLLKELRGSSKFLVRQYNSDNNQLNLEYLN